MTEAEQIAQYIAERGVTKCDPGYAAATQIAAGRAVVVTPERPVSKAAAFRKRQAWSHPRRRRA
jgi:hypothetical protein